MASSSRSDDAAAGLPPVKPPSGRFIVQLFLIPGLIVAGLVLVLAFGGLIWVGTSDPESFLARLDNPNPDIRWRAANDLVQVLKRPESLEMASDPDFALDLAERLQKALEQLEQAEAEAGKEFNATSDRIEKDKSLSAEEKAKRSYQADLAAWNKLEKDRTFVLFLTSSLGEFNIPVGVHVLSQIALKDNGPELKALALRRVRAVQALANLGNNMKQHYFGKNVIPETKVLSSAQKEAILNRLAKSAAGTSDRAKMAQYAHDVLLNREPSKVDVVMAKCAEADDIFLREMVAMALISWDGDLVEPTLLKLSRDDGRGKFLSSPDGK